MSGIYEKRDWQTTWKLQDDSVTINGVFFQFVSMLLPMLLFHCMERVMHKFSYSMLDYESRGRDGSTNCLHDVKCWCYGEHLYVFKITFHTRFHIRECRKTKIQLVSPCSSYALSLFDNFTMWKRKMTFFPPSSHSWFFFASFLFLLFTSPILLMLYMTSHTALELTRRCLNNKT